MDHFLDLEILPDPEFSQSLLLNTLFAKLHRALVDRSHNDIGISFPNAQKQLGNVLRLHGSRAGLTQFLDGGWQHSMRDHVAVSEVGLVPANCKYQKIRRVQVKSNVGRLLRRSVAKGWITEQEAIERLNRSQPQQTKLPYLEVKSHSTRQAFKLFIKLGEPMDTAIAGEFNTYGLSRTATLPIF